MTTKSAVLRAIHDKCLDCSVYQPKEVRLCPVTRCALWPFRFGTDPAPVARGFRKSSVCTKENFAKLVPGYGDTALPPSLEKSPACTGDFAEGGQSQSAPEEVA
jgi:hypothetical protein